MNANKNEARAHHYVPQCWLAGFTDSGEKDGFLYVTDIKRKKQFRCKPSEVGHRRDFNRIDHPDLADPNAIEKAFSKVEGKVAPVFKKLFVEKRGPENDIEFGSLIDYIAIQIIRVPSFRAFIKNMADKFIKEEVLTNPDAWNRARDKAGIAADDPVGQHSEMVKAISSGQVYFDPQTAFYMKHGAMQLPDLVKSLAKRRWHWLISQSGQFLGSDSPVAIDGPFGEAIGWSNAHFVLYPVNRHLVLVGTHEAVDPPYVTTKLIARINSFMMISADEQVYSHRPDFHWLSAAEKCQQDWKLFSKDDFNQ